MNIFATDHDPQVSAENLDDLRVNNMIFETAQLLSTACVVSGVSSNKLYKPTHINHPSNIWERQTHGNFVWLCAHGIALADVFQQHIALDDRRQHASLSIILEALKHKNSIAPGPRNQFAIAITDLDKHPDWLENDKVVDAYKHYMIYKWNTDTKPPKWNHRGPPLWYSIGF